MISKYTTVLVLFLSLYSSGQTFKGKVLDAATNTPLESVSVYFDNTTIGTITNDNGEFSIEYNDAIQSTLVISFLGYEKVFISDYRNQNNSVIKLKEATNQLDTVVVNADDGMSRAIKMQMFKREFLGRSENGKSCKILNEDDVRLRYSKKNKTITAWAKKPIIISNKNLKYEISFDLIDFEMSVGTWGPSSVVYTGTSFYKDLNTNNKKRISKNRKKAYEGSVQHFMRALYNKDLENQGYILGKKGFKVNPYDIFTISEADTKEVKTITLKEKIDIFYNSVIGSVIQTTVESFSVDEYGNYWPIPQVLFGGALGKQRMGDALPSDYGL